MCCFLNEFPRSQQKLSGWMSAMCPTSLGHPSQDNLGELDFQWVTAMLLGEKMQADWAAL
jgi:hypothetical protein